MAVVFGPAGPGVRRSALSIAFGLGVVAAGWSPSLAETPRSPASTAPLIVLLDQAQTIKLSDQVGTLVIGNPLIADVSVQTGGVVVLTGKGYGTTNLLALDRAGTVLTQTQVQVQAARDVVVVYRGIERESYSCTPTCERRITLGDSPAYFDAVIGQTTSRNGQAQIGVQSTK
jgi:Flp pilus assembly secretin CpaC